MRPKPIITFERLFLLAILLSTVQLAVEANKRIGGVGPATEIFVGAGVAMLSVVLVLLASRRRSNVARWLLVAFTAAGLVTTGIGIGAMMREGRAFDSLVVVDLVALGLQVVAVALLFAREARGWFARADLAGV